MTMKDIKRNVKNTINRARRRIPDMGGIKHNIKSNIKIPENAKAKALEQHKKFKRHISKNLPANGNQLGKQINKKISSSNKIWSNVGVAFFGQKSLENLTHFSSYFLGFFMLILVDLVMIFPTERKALAIDALVVNFFAVLAGLILINIITFVAMKAIGSKATFKVFFSTVNTALFMSLLIFSIPIALVSFALFSTMLKSQTVINMFFSLIPLYNYLIYGWSSEMLSRLKGIRSIIIALIALLLILFLNLLLPYLMV